MSLAKRRFDMGKLTDFCESLEDAHSTQEIINFLEDGESLGRYMADASIEDDETFQEEVDGLHADYTSKLKAGV